MKAELESASPDAATVGGYVISIHQLDADLEASRDDLDGALREILTDEQETKLEAWKAANPGPRRGFGPPGPGWGGPRHGQGPAAPMATMPATATPAPERRPPESSIGSISPAAVVSTAAFFSGWPCGLDRMPASCRGPCVGGAGGSCSPASYLALLIASRAVEPPYEREPGPELEVSALPAVRGEAIEPETVRLAWRRWAPEAAPGGPIPIVLLHGSPGSHRDFDRLAPPLAARGWTLYAPDLPGFGASSRRVPDYSIARARPLRRGVARQLGIERAHVLGFSMGGGVALELYRPAPERVASVVLLSSIGVQEMELLGDYSLNHAAARRSSSPALWFLHRAVPHFGALTHFPLDLPYARNFYDTDQRPLRGTLASIEPPVLIVHGREDFLVPQEAAVEHHRLAAAERAGRCSRPATSSSSRGEPDVRPALADFWDRVERGEATTRATAPRRSRAAGAGAVRSADRCRGGWARLCSPSARCSRWRLW